MGRVLISPSLWYPSAARVCSTSGKYRHDAPEQAHETAIIFQQRSKSWQACRNDRRTWLNDRPDIAIERCRYAALVRLFKNEQGVCLTRELAIAFGEGRELNHIAQTYDRGNNAADMIIVSSFSKIIGKWYLQEAKPEYSRKHELPLRIQVEIVDHKNWQKK